MLSSEFFHHAIKRRSFLSGLGRIISQGRYLSRTFHKSRKNSFHFFLTLKPENLLTERAFLGSSWSTRQGSQILHPMPFSLFQSMMWPQPLQHVHRQNYQELPRNSFRSIQKLGNSALLIIWLKSTFFHSHSNVFIKGHLSWKEIAIMSTLC